MIDVRLVAYAPNGTRLGQLPDALEADLGQPLDDLPSLRLTYSAHARGAELLAEPCEVAAEIYDPTTGVWTEHPDSRFLRLQRGGSPVDPTGQRTYTLPGYGWQMRKIRLYPPADSGDLVDGKRAFLSATAGTILRTFVTEWHNRGGASAFDVDFTTTADSAGASWDKIITIYYSPGIDLLTVIANLAEQGVIDWQVQGRTLRAYNADSVLGRDLATGTGPVELRIGRDITEAPDDGSLEDVVTDVYLQGDEGFSLQLNNANAESPWGRWEDYITQGGVSDEGTATLLADAALQRGSQERVQITRGLDFTRAEWLPWVHYRPGDYVRASGDSGTMTRLRIRQLTLTRGGDGHVSGNVVLNDRFLEREIRLARRTSGIVGGATADGGSGAQPAPEGPDTRQPAAPDGLIVSTDAYLDSDGAARGQITATWGLVTSGVDGNAIEVGGYELYHRVNQAGRVWFRAATVDDPDNTATVSDYNTGEEWAFKVRAVSANGVRGPFSAQYAVVIADDTEPPPVPSAPALSTRMGVIEAAWDGLGAAGEIMPPDYLHTVVEMRDGETWDETWASGTIDPPWEQSTGAWAVDAGGAYGTTDNNYLTRDLGVLDQDVTLYIDPPSAGENTIAILLRLSDEAGSGFGWTLVIDDQAAPTVMRMRFQGWTLTQWLNGSLYSAGAVTPSQDHLVTTMAIRYAGAGDARITRVHGPEGGAWRPVGVMEDGPASVLVPDQPYNEPRWFRQYTLDRSGNASAPSAESQISTTPLVDTDVYPDVIKAGHLMANAVTADKIRAGSVEAVHIAAEAIDGKTITGATIRSAASGQRWVADVNGIRLINSSGQTVAEFSSATGNASIAGRFQSGMSNDNEIIVDSNLFRGRPAVHFGTGAPSYDLQPVAQSMGTGSDGYPAGAFIISGRELTANSSGRSDLEIQSGNEGVWLGYQHGPYAGVGVQTLEWALRLRGRLGSLSHSRDLLVWWQSSQATNSGVNWTLTYGASAANGGRLLICVGHGANTLSRAVIATVTGQNLGNAYAYTSLPAGSATHRIQYVSVWVDQDVSGA